MWKRVLYFGGPLSRAVRQLIAENLERSRYFSCLCACQTIVPHGTVDAFLANGHTHNTVNVCTYM